MFKRYFDLVWVRSGLILVVLFCIWFYFEYKQRRKESQALRHFPNKVAAYVMERRPGLDKQYILNYKFQDSIIKSVYYAGIFGPDLNVGDSIYILVLRSNKNKFMVCESH